MNFLDCFVGLRPPRIDIFQLPHSALRILHFLLIFHVVSALAFAADQPEEYRITSLKGTVAILPRKAGHASPAAKNIRLAPGDRIMTGRNGKVELSTKKGTVLELQEYSNFEVQSLSTKVHVFILKVGRFLARFSPEKKKRRFSYQIHTPVAVAAVRGTDLALVVDENQEVQAGVIEGDVVFGPLEEATKEEKELWEDEISVGTSKGIIIRPKAPPIPVPTIPPLVVSSLEWFEHVQDRVPKIQDEWEKIDVKKQEILRREILKKKVDWTPPPIIEPKKPDIPKPK